MRRLMIVALFALLLPISAHAQTEQQTMVDRATLTVQDMLGDNGSTDARNMLRKAKGVMVCPRIFKAGFILGGQGGGCIMAGRTRNGWTNPAFYGLGSGSIGFQIGIQDAQIIFIVLTEKGLQALLDSQFKFGADASVAVVSGSTTAALNADIVAFATARGLFAGVSIDGSLISSRSDWNQEYYGQALAAQQIVLSNQGNNPGAEPLREILSRYSGG